MSDPGERDVLHKADALLRRHSAPGEDATPVPVLTDLVDAPHTGEAAGIAHEVMQRVLPQVEARLAAEIERRLAAHLAAQVPVALAEALAQLRPELARTIDRAVAEALEGRQVK